MLSIRWYRSLRFKLLLLVASLLFLALAVVTYRNANVFGTYLSRSSSENALGTTQRIAESVKGLVDQWSLLAGVIAHMDDPAEAYGVGSAKSASVAKAIVSSNRDFAAIDVFFISAEDEEARSAEPAQMGHFSSPHPPPPEVPILAGASVTDKLKNLSARRRELIVADPVSSNSDNPDSALQPQIWSLQESEGLPAIQLFVPFSVEKRKGKLGVLLTVWATRISALLERSDGNSTSLLAADGTQFFRPENRSSFHEVVLANRSEIVGSMAQGKLQQTLREFALPNGNHVAISYARVSDYGLLVELAYNTSLAAEHIAAQERQVMVAGWILFLLAVGASYVGSRRILKNIGDIVNASASIARGEFERRISVRGSDELSCLASSINSMALDLRNLVEVREDAVRKSQELLMAKTVQTLLLPKATSTQKGLVIRSYFRPASECAGDWWGFFDLGMDRHLVMIVDVTGHGASAAILTSAAYSYCATLKALMDSDSLKFPSPSELLKGLHTILWNTGAGQCTMTATVLLFDCKTAKLYFANAGHPKPIIFRNRDAKSLAPVKEVLNLSGGVVGMTSVPKFPEGEVDFRVGDTLFVYTDGLFECTNAAGNCLRKKNFVNLVGGENQKGIEHLSSTLYRGMDQFFGDKSLDDDVTVLLISLGENSEGVTV